MLNLKCVTITIGLVALTGAFTAHAADAAKDFSGCREVTRQVAVWPKASHPGKSLRTAKFETRRFAVCEIDGGKSGELRTAQRTL